MASLSLEHIEKKYPNGFHAVKDFNLEIKDKEVHHLRRPLRLRKIHHPAYGGRSGGYFFRHS